MSEGPFLLNVQGYRPHKINVWKVYRFLPNAKAQATRLTRTPRGEPVGDWTAVIFRLDPDDLTIHRVDPA